jgi:hypothetical protein
VCLYTILVRAIVRRTPLLPIIAFFSSRIKWALNLFDSPVLQRPSVSDCTRSLTLRFLKDVSWAGPAVDDLAGKMVTRRRYATPLALLLVVLATAACTTLSHGRPDDDALLISLFIACQPTTSAATLPTVCKLSNENNERYAHDVRDGRIAYIAWQYPVASLTNNGAVTVFDADFKAGA